MSVFFRRLAEALACEPVALATVVEARGSTPRIAGARQFFDGRGESFGSVGGGTTEARVSLLARETLEDGRPRVFEADLRGRPGDIREGICGGVMTTWIQRLEPERDLPLVREVWDRLRRGLTVELCTARERLSFGSAGEEVYAERLTPSPRLLVAGAGHVGRSLARTAGDLGLDVMVQDDRPEWLLESAFAGDCGLEPSLEKAAAALAGWEGQRLVALVTRGLAQDLEALRRLASVPRLDYLGLLGSKKRVKIVLAQCREAGFDIPRSVLHAPIGLEIGAETPEEIAISISAEIVTVLRRAGRS